MVGGLFLYGCDHHTLRAAPPRRMARPSPRRRLDLLADQLVGAACSSTAAAEELPRVAVVCTSYFAGSHADVLVSSFCNGCATDEGVLEPRFRVVSMYVDQIHADDIGRQVAAQHDIKLFSSIRDALLVGSGSEQKRGATEGVVEQVHLGVDAVLLIGEHGDYPKTPLGQEMVPRRAFFEQIVGTLLEAGTPIPICESPKRPLTSQQGLQRAAACIAASQ